MGAALTIAVIMALSVTIVRISSVAMRLTGLPEHIARFQCLSALTGAGFTTSESEMIVNYPIRRRILVYLMIIGNLGLASLGATLIVTFVQTGTDTRAIAFQAVSIAVAIAFILLVQGNKTLDRVMCDSIGKLLRKYTLLGQRRYHRLLQLDDGASVAEHQLTTPSAIALETLKLESLGLVAISVRGTDIHQSAPLKAETIISPGDIITCSGRDSAHNDFEDLIAQIADRDKNGGELPP